MKSMSKEIGVRTTLPRFERVHFVERRDHMQARIGDSLASVIEGGESVVPSEIGVAERLYGAYKLSNVELESRYLEVFANSAMFDIVSVDGERLKAARLGARNGLELVDAIHFAAAIERRRQVFLADDERIRPEVQ